MKKIAIGFGAALVAQLLVEKYAKKNERSGIVIDAASVVGGMLIMRHFNPGAALVNTLLGGMVAHYAAVRINGIH